MTSGTEDFQEERTSLAKERTKLANERNRLANERTFLAWVRTGLAMVGGGVAVLKFLTFEHPIHIFLAQIIGVLLITMGIVMFILSSIDFITSSKESHLINGYAGSFWVISAIAITLVLISLGFIFMSRFHS